MTLIHPEFGEISYNKILLEIDKPVLFVCSFKNSQDSYVGILVDEFIKPSAEWIECLIYYFVGVNDSEINSLANGLNLSLNEIFNNRPVWYLQYQHEGGDEVHQRWKKESSISPIYQFAEGTKLT